MQSKTVAIILFGLVCISALLVFMQPVVPPETETGSMGERSVNEAGESAAKVQPKKTSIELKAGKRVSGPAVIRVKQGEALVLEFVSDQDAELHLHGYDHRLMLKANEPLVHSFVAEHSGRFEYELHGHGSHHALGVIEVLPQ